MTNMTSLTLIQKKMVLVESKEALWSHSLGGHRKSKRGTMKQGLDRVSLFLAVPLKAELHCPRAASVSGSSQPGIPQHTFLCLTPAALWAGIVWKQAHTCLRIPVYCKFPCLVPKPCLQKHQVPIHLVKFICFLSLLLPAPLCSNSIFLSPPYFSVIFFVTLEDIRQKHFASLQGAHRRCPKSGA